MLATACRNCRVLAIAAVTLLLITSTSHPDDSHARYSANALHSPGLITRVSVASDGTEGNAESDDPSISADGRYVAFHSYASNLVGNDTNKQEDIFVHDRQSGETTRVSVGTGGGQGNGFSFAPSISADGRYVAFASTASNLVGHDANHVTDVFVHDRQTHQTTCVSVSPTGDANYGSTYPAISADGRFVAFESGAGNLVLGDTNGDWDIFVRDRHNAQTRRVSVSSFSGVQGNGPSNEVSISANGRYVAFRSFASNLVGGDTNNQFDVFVHDRQNGEMRRVSVASDGTQGNGFSDLSSLSDAGRYVAFESGSTNLVPGDSNAWDDIFVHDLTTGQTTRVSVASDGSQANGPSYNPSISGDGRYVAFMSSANNLVGGDTNSLPDIFVHDRQTGQTTRVSVGANGAQANSASTFSSVSADGGYVAFDSYASNLVSDDSGYTTDVFVHEYLPGVMFLPVVSKP
jgi:Tol biopolymer transport system component